MNGAVSARQRGVGAWLPLRNTRTGESSARSLERHYGPKSRPLGMTMAEWRERAGVDLRAHEPWMSRG